MRIEASQSMALAIDYQKRLMPAIHNETRVTENSVLLLKGLKLLEVPVLITQQNTKGLGMSIPEIYEAAETEEYIDKMSFSVYGDTSLRETIEKLGRRQIILCGVEAHICVLQTGIDLKDAGFEPILVTDCVSSRKEEDRQTAIYRAMQEGIRVTTYEALLFELLKSAGSYPCREILRLVK